MAPTATLPHTRLLAIIGCVCLAMLSVVSAGSPLLALNACPTMAPSVQAVDPNTNAGGLGLGGVSRPCLGLPVTGLYSISGFTFYVANEAGSGAITATLSVLDYMSSNNALATVDVTSQLPTDSTAVGVSATFTTVTLDPSLPYILALCVTGGDTDRKLLIKGEAIAPPTYTYYCNTDPFNNAASCSTGVAAWLTKDESVMTPITDLVASCEAPSSPSPSISSTPAVATPTPTVTVTPTRSPTPSRTPSPLPLSCCVGPQRCT